MLLTGDSRCSFIKNFGRWMVTRVLIGIDGISGEIKYDPGLSEVAVLEWYLFVVFRAEIVMTEDEIGDVGNRGVNQRNHILC